ncbi:hypothetical protein [Burkholderia sp. PU8-34]
MGDFCQHFRRARDELWATCARPWRPFSSRMVIALNDLAGGRSCVPFSAFSAAHFRQYGHFFALLRIPFSFRIIDAIIPKQKSQ